MQNTQTLLENLLTLQCHFTWNFVFEDTIDVEFLLKNLTHQVEHTPYLNPGTYMTMKAFLYHLQKHYTEALASLQEAERLLKKDSPTNDPCQVLMMYGNYAWIYYHLANYCKVEKYLDKIHGICQSLKSSQPYAVTTPQILAQKGWSFLAAGFQHAEAAIACFQAALREDQTKEEFKAGLATSFYASWEQFGVVSNWDKAKGLLEELVPVQPQNWDIKVYLASLLLTKEKERAYRFLEEVIQNSHSLEILRKAANLCVCAEPQQLSQAIYILKKAINLDANYPLLYYDLGLCYKLQAEEASPNDREKILGSATRCLLWATEMGSLFIDPRLELAKIYGEKDSVYEEVVYQHLMEELPNASKRYQHAIYLHWGDFLLQKKGLKHKALVMYKTGFRISGGHSREREQLLMRLMDLAKMFQEDTEMDQVDAINNFIQTMGYHDPDMEKACPWWRSNRVWR